MSEYGTIRSLAESVSEPWVLWTDEPAEVVHRVFWPYDARNAQLSVRWLNGRRMATSVDAMDELASALQFPWYFGRNWDAVNECLHDGDWERKRSYMLFVRYASEALAREPTDGLSHLVEVFRHASQAGSVEHQHSFDEFRPPTPFHTVFVVEPGTQPPWLAALATQGLDIPTLPLRDLRSWPD